MSGEARIEKQLRKGIEAFKDVNFFKAVCCYSKVSKVFENAIRSIENLLQLST